MSNERRITIRDVAKAAGLSKSAVSLALRNDPSLPPATREKIRSVAARLGYRPDPMLSSLAHYRYGNAPAGAPVVGWLSNWPTRDEWRNDAWVHHYNGACRRAEGLGYRLEHFWLREPGMSAARWEQMFQTRGIRGLIVAPQPMAHRPPELTWSRYAAVTIGYSLKTPALHTVASFHFRSMGIVLKELRKRGYERIGFAVSSLVDERNEHSIRAAFLLDGDQNRAEAIPPLVFRESQRQRFCGWFQEHRPDVVVTAGSDVATAIRGWWRDLGVAVPGDVGLVVLSNVALGGELTGIHEHPEKIGATAIDVLGSLLYHNDLGLPDFPICALIDGSWVDGKTVRK